MSNHLKITFLIRGFFDFLETRPEILIFFIEVGILEAKTECYAKDKVKSPLCFRSFYGNF